MSQDIQQKLHKFFLKSQDDPLKQKIIAQLKKKVLRAFTPQSFPQNHKSQNDPLKQKIIIRLKKKSASFHTTSKFFFTPIQITFLSFLKILHRLQKSYTILDGTDGRFFHV